MTHPELQDRAMRLFGYLAELARLRMRVTYDLSQYEHVFWLHDIPQADACFSRAQDGDEDFEHDLWLKVHCPEQPPCPPVPEVCQPWVDPKQLKESESEPELYPEILPEPEVGEPAATDEADAPVSPVTPFRLADYPDVTDEWQKYLEGAWRPWAERHRLWRRIHAAYHQLFSIHQALERLGEQYELVLGLGYLTWQADGARRIRRHLLCAQATISFDAERAVFTVRTGSEGAKLAIENEVFEPVEEPAGNIRASIESLLETARENPWNCDAIHSIVRSWVQSLHSRGSYGEELSPHDVVDGEPRASFAPALLLRKRSARTFQTLANQIAEQIKEAEQAVPDGVRRLVSTDGTPGQEATATTDPGQADAAPERLYFPLPCNREQERIVQRLDRNDAVLVQGPPGTGKSHTIANLISHLLASDERVLVTAQTPRALKVLQDKLPADLQALCVSLLGNDRAALENLERAVATITDRYADWDPAANTQEVDQLENRLTKLKSELAQCDRRLREVREKDLAVHEIADGVYRGTAQQIAVQVGRESEQYNWLRDEVPPEQALPASPETFQELHQIYLHYSPAQWEELERSRPASEQLPTPEAFTKLLDEEARARETFDQRQQAASPNLIQVVTEAGLEAARQLEAAVRSLQEARRIAQARLEPWVEKAIREILGQQDQPWRVLRTQTAEVLDQLSDRVAEADRCEVAAPADASPATLLADAADLKAHLEKGGWWGFGPLASRVVRRTRYLRKSVRVDGRPCDSPEMLAKLIDILRCGQQLDYLWKLWAGKAERIEGAFSVQAAQLSEHLEALDMALALTERLGQVQEITRRLPNLPGVDWVNESTTGEILAACEAVNAQHELADCQKKLHELTTLIRKHAAADNAHPVCERLIEAIEQANRGAYAAAVEQLQDLEVQDRICRRQMELEDTLGGVAPRLLVDMAKAPQDPAWQDRLMMLSEAWRWARARTWLHRLAEEDVEALESSARNLIRRIEQTTAELAAARAWGHFFERLTDHERAHLIAWQQEMKKIGKGTGKHAAYHRRVAQKNLDECRTAIPAWVMPLYRLFETINPQPQMFDVIIVDEASQCGPEALALFYLAKRLIIVGDDQQISPDAVGLDQHLVQQLVARHLKDIPLAESFDTNTSLFDHGTNRLKDRIVLREHFRCMPEIIRFSNDLCYQRQPLIPLRQYPPQRLEPIVVRHVPEGVREGDGNSIVNRPEAEALVDAVVACCRDPRYVDKSMGVISLQGDAQAKLIEQQLMERLDSREIEKRRLLCGNAYSFQGDERDVMFLGLVAAPPRIGALTKAADMRRFNVAASRARDQMWLFHTATLSDLSRQDVRHALLNHCLKPQAQSSSWDDEQVTELRSLARSDRRNRRELPEPFDSWFEVNVFLEILDRGYRVVPQFEIRADRTRRYRIDLVVEGARTRLAVECDGDEHHGIEQFEADLERQRTLERCGWRFWRLRGVDYYRDPQEALVPLWQRLDEMGIRPVTFDSTWTEPVGMNEDDLPAGHAAESDQSASSHADTKGATSVGGSQTPLWPDNGDGTLFVDNSDTEPQVRVASNEASPQAEKGQHPADFEGPQREPIGASGDDPIAESDPADPVAQVAQHAPAMWFALAKWAKENDQFTSKARNLLYKIGQYLARDWEITTKQADYAMKLHAQAVEQGFDAQNT